MGCIYLSNMRREFHNLKQRHMGVTEYQREFTQLSKYDPEMLVIEEERTASWIRFVFQVGSGTGAQALHMAYRIP